MMDGLKVHYSRRYSHGGCNVYNGYQLGNTASGWTTLGSMNAFNFTNAAGHTVGSMFFVGPDKKMHAQLATKFNMGDHNLGMKVSSTGAA